MDSDRVTTSAETGTPDPLPPPPPKWRERRRRRYRRLLWIRRIRRAFMLLFFVVGGVLGVLFHWQPGQELVLETGLDRLRGALAGELTVGGIRSGTLLTGATLLDVSLTGAGDRPFLSADSVVVRYSLSAIVAGAPPLRSVTLWGADIEIARESEAAPLNIQGLVVPSRDTTSSPPSSLSIGRIAIRDGTFRLLGPAEAGTRLALVPREDGTTLQAISLDGIDLDLESVVINPRPSTTLEGRLASLTADVGILREPLRIQEAFGDVTVDRDGIGVRSAAFRLPGTLLRGELVIGPEERPDDPWIVRTALDIDGWGDLDDIRWIDPRIPEGRFRGAIGVSIPDAIEVELDGIDVQLEASVVSATGSLHIADEMTLRRMEVTASPLVVERLEPWLDLDVPFDGWLSGEATFSGTFSDLGATGRVTLVPTGFGAQPTIADFSGVLHSGADPGATDLQLRLDPLNYTVLRAIWPQAPLGGSGEAQLEIGGRASAGLTVVADVIHRTERADTSRVAVRGLLRRLDDDGWVTDLRGDLAPLSLGMLQSLAPSVPLGGAIRGPVAASGRLDDLTMSVALEHRGGRVRVDARTDLTEPAAGYRVELSGTELPLDSVLPDLPEGSLWSGVVEASGRGFALDSMDTRVLIETYASRVGPVAVDTLGGDFRIRRGVLTADTVVATVGGVELAGAGGLGVAPGSWGSANLAFQAETLVGLRPLLMGVSDSVLTRDGLGELERAFMRASGIDPDTLPSEADVRLTGAVTGSASISGELRSLDLGLLLDVDGAAFRRNEVGSARVALTASGLPDDAGSWGFGVTAADLVWEGRYFAQGGLEAYMTDLVGSGRVELVRSQREQYRLAGDFDFRTPRRVVDVEDGQIQIGDEFWNVTEPARLVWDGRSLAVDSLLIQRAGDDPMSLVADGRLTRGESSDFRIDLDGLHVDRITHVGQFSDVEIGGHVDLDLHVVGPAEDPRIDASFRVDGPRYGSMELTRLDGELTYLDQSAAVTLTGWDGGRDAILATGTIPLDLSLGTVEQRLLDRSMDFQVTADSLDAAIALSYLTTLEQVLGSVSGEVLVRGTPSRPEPEGRLSLTGGEWTIETIGVRHGNVDGEVVLRPDRTVDVQLTSTGGGYSRVTGTVLLDPVRDPVLDLALTFDRFQAVDRLDLEGLVTGDVVLQGSYRRPVMTGTVIVDEGTVYVDEFQRAAGVVDLTDPFLFERGLGVDTTALLSQPLVAGLRNPFFDNLRVDVNLSVPGNTWLRSIETNVEMQGDLTVAYDRSQADLVLVGELEAVRGSHLVLGRTFEVDGGNVRFIGRPGFDPDLNIDASARILRREDDDLVVSAHVGGRLVQPIVTLSTEEVATSEADIISYLVFGQASGELGSTRAGALGGISDNAAISTLGAGGFTYVSGALANQFGASLAQTSLLDYVSIQSVGTQGDVARQLFGRTQLEAGRYLGRKTFVVLVFRPLTGEGTDNANFLGGARVQIKPVDDYHIDLFVEDRFLRSGTAGFTLPGLLDNTYVYGFLLFRDWGY